MNPLPFSPAVVAALNHWGLIGNVNQNQNQDQQKYDNFKGGNQPWSRQQGNGPPSQGGNDPKTHFL